MKNKERVSQLLDRVELEKYIPAKEFVPEDWYRNISLRISLLDAVRPPDFEGEPSILTRLLESPLEMPWSIYPLAERNVVADLTALDIYREKLQFAQVKPHVHQLLEGLHSTADLLYENRWKLPAEAWIPSSIYYRPRPFDVLVGSNTEWMQSDPAVVVNLKATDAQLIDSFKTWLEKQRMAQRERNVALPREKPFSDKDFRKWNQHRVLPYLDMRIALQMMDMRASHRVIGDKLYRDQDVDTAERVRKTLDPIVRAIFEQCTSLNFGLQSPHVE